MRHRCWLSPTAHSWRMRGERGVAALLLLYWLLLLLLLCVLLLLCCLPTKEMSCCACLRVIHG